MNDPVHELIEDFLNGSSIDELCTKYDLDYALVEGIVRLASKVAAK